MLHQSHRALNLDTTNDFKLANQVLNLDINLGYDLGQNLGENPILRSLREEGMGRCQAFQDFGVWDRLRIRQATSAIDTPGGTHSEGRRV